MRATSSLETAPLFPCFYRLLPLPSCHPHLAVSFLLKEYFVVRDEVGFRLNLGWQLR